MNELSQIAANKNEHETNLLLKRVLGHTPLVVELVDRLRSGGFRFDDGTMIFGTQHLMSQTLAMCWAFRQLGVQYANIGLCGKVYSTHEATVRDLRKLGVVVPDVRTYDSKKSYSIEQVSDLKSAAREFSARGRTISGPVVIVLDDGGHALSNFCKMVSPPYRVAGVEQTASGFWQPGIQSVPFPIVDVAASAVKRVYEPTLIVDAALARVRASIKRPLSNFSCGVIGLGHIGHCLASRLLSEGCLKAVYDKRTEPRTDLDEYRSKSVVDLIDECDLIFGCSGVDVTQGMFSDVQGSDSEPALRPVSRIFVSLSSGDDEFFSLKQRLLLGRSSAPMEYSVRDISDLSGSVWGATTTILRNGFPINFDNGDISVPLELIQGTVCALIAAVCQASNLVGRRGDVGLASRAERVMLDCGFQRWLSKRWGRYLADGAHRTTWSGKPMPFDREAIKQLSNHHAGPKSVDAGHTFDVGGHFWCN